MRIADLQGFDNLKYEPWPPRISPDVDLGAGMFNMHRPQATSCCCIPYESFEPVVRLIEEAADDPDVLAIKQTLVSHQPQQPDRRGARARPPSAANTSRPSSNCKARFDEARNIEWARNLERAGVQVIYGVKGLKTHAKICIIVRREPHGIVRYVHFGTGNYNEITARIYSDVSLMTCERGNSAPTPSTSSTPSRVFRSRSGSARSMPLRMGLRERIIEMIDAETDRKNHGQKVADHRQIQLSG